MTSGWPKYSSRFWRSACTGSGGARTTGCSTTLDLLTNKSFSWSYAAVRKLSRESKGLSPTVLANELIVCWLCKRLEIRSQFFALFNIFTKIRKSFLNNENRFIDNDSVARHRQTLIKKYSLLLIYILFQFTLILMNKKKDMHTLS